MRHSMAGQTILTQRIASHDGHYFGRGIGGLVTALSLHRAGIPCRIYEAVPEIRALGVGINLLPHAVRELTELGLADRLAETAIPTAELIYANRHGQRIWREARGRDAGYNWPQFSISAARCRSCFAIL